MNYRYVNWYIGMGDGYMRYYGVQYLSPDISFDDVFTFSELTDDTAYSIYAEINYIADGAYRSVTVESTCVKTVSARGALRPNRFYWTNDKQPKCRFNLTVDEWNNLLDNINAVRNYKHISDYNFTYACQNNSFTAAMYNQAVYAIQEAAEYGTKLHIVSKGGTIYASLLNDLVSELNNIT
jgi:hypothetical protein